MNSYKYCKNRKKQGAPDTTGIFLEPFYDSHRKEIGLFAIIVKFEVRSFLDTEITVTSYL